MMPTLFLYPLLGPRALGEGDRAALWRGRRLPGDTANQAPDHTTVARLHAQRVTYGATIARNRAAHRIVIFQDTLERDFGSDPDLLPPGRAHPAPRGRTPPRLQRASVAALGL